MKAVFWLTYGHLHSLARIGRSGRAGIESNPLSITFQVGRYLRIAKLEVQSFVSMLLVSRIQR